MWWFGAYRYTPPREQNYPTLNETQLSWSPNYTGKRWSYDLTLQAKAGRFLHPLEQNSSPII